MSLEEKEIYTKRAREVWDDYLSSTPAREPKPRKQVNIFFFHNNSLSQNTSLIQQLILILTGQSSDKVFPWSFSECDKTIHT